MGGEDFSEYGRTVEHVPLCMFRIGAVAPGKMGGEPADGSGAAGAAFKPVRARARADDQDRRRRHVGRGPGPHAAEPPRRAVIGPDGSGPACPCIADGRRVIPRA